MTTTHTITFDESQRQSTIMALAHLAVERPGWDTMLKETAQLLDNPGVPMYLSFKEMHQAKVTEDQDFYPNPPIIPPGPEEVRA
jgi:hypothetical protein